MKKEIILMLVFVLGFGSVLFAQDIKTSDHTTQQMPSTSRKPRTIGKRRLRRPAANKSKDKCVSQRNSSGESKSSVMDSPNRLMLDPADVPATDKRSESNDDPLTKIPDVIDPAETPRVKKLSKPKTKRP